MTYPLPGADIPGYYAAIGINLAVQAHDEAAVRCFANPDEHRRADRNPSCSVNLDHGAWHCHGCGAHGGAFDAATTRGHSGRAAIDLMVAHGLTEHRPHRTHQPRTGRPASTSKRPRPRDDPRRELQADEDDIRRWQAHLAEDTDLLGKLRCERGWRHHTILDLGLGLDRGRITIPIRNKTSELIGVLRYQPSRQSGAPKMLAAPGTRLGLIPHPAAEPAEHVLIVEGPPDMITARSCGACAIAVPGDHAWQPSWADSLDGRNITIVMDCDPAGRAAAERIAHDLTRVATTQTVDLAPHRDDGYDLTDWLEEERDGEGRCPWEFVPGGPRSADTLDPTRRNQ